MKEDNKSVNRLINVLQDTQLKLTTCVNEHHKPLKSQTSRQFTTIQFTVKASNARTLKEACELEEAMLKFILTDTNYISRQAPEMQAKSFRLLRQYIELYVSDPKKYPKDPDNEVHCLVNDVGNRLNVGHFDIQDKQCVKVNHKAC